MRKIRCACALIGKGRLGRPDVRGLALTRDELAVANAPSSASEALAGRPQIRIRSHDPRLLL